MTLRAVDTTWKWSGVSDLIVVGAASVQSAVFGANTHCVRISTAANCWVNIGTNPTAVASDNNGFLLPAGQVDYIHVVPGQRLAVIQDAASTGNFCIAEMTR
jgi:FtsP/CotA-like multicopper oxidase with cupredoxin domain